jgi:hypothetical protein
MPWRSLASVLLMVSGSGCAMQCGATPEKLAKLQRGMSYEETSGIMGCPGTTVSEFGSTAGDYSTVEWNGPDSALFIRTRIDFLDGKLLSYTTETRGAW